MINTYSGAIHLDLGKRQTLDFGGVKLHYIKADLDRYLVFPDSTGAICVGVDPGIHFGITILSHFYVGVMWGALPHLDQFPGVEAINFVHRMLSNESPWEMIFRSGVAKVIRVEGPAYREMVGQPLLEQVRFGFAYGFMQMFKDVSYMQPNTARYRAFGHGTKAGKDIWVNVDENAADSIGLALGAAYDYVSQFERA